MKISSKKNKVLIAVIVVVLAVVLLNIFQKETRSFFYSISAPIQKALWKAGDRTSDFFTSLFRGKILMEERDELKVKNQELLFQLLLLGEIKEENKTLRKALGLELQKEFKLVLTQIISKDISQDYFLINKGSKDGVEENMPVITEQKVLVGKISEVYSKSSKVMLISNKKSSFDVEIKKSGKNISGIVKGEGNSKIFLDFVPREETLSEGDVIITSVLGGIFPEGLLVGKIKEVKKIDVEPFQQAEIEPFFEISQAENIFIILDF